LPGDLSAHDISQPNTGAHIANDNRHELQVLAERHDIVTPKNATEMIDRNALWHVTIGVPVPRALATASLGRGLLAAKGASVLMGEFLVTGHS